MLNLKNVNKLTVNSKKAKVNTLTNIFLEIKQGDFVCIQGANGAGKSALLSIISGDDMSFDGEYFIDGIELSKYTSKQLQVLRSSRFGVVPELCDLIKKRTIEQNLELALRIANMPKEERKNAIVKAVNSVGLSEKILSLKPSDLSVGQCQRVMVARAIVSNPQVIIADNPTSLMDEEASDLVLNLFSVLNRGGVTVVVVSRDERFLKKAKRVFTMSRGMLVENLKVTRGKNVGEVIDIDAKKKTAKTSIKKQVIVPEKKVKEIESNESVKVENELKAEVNKTEEILTTQKVETESSKEDVKPKAKSTKSKKIEEAKEPVTESAEASKNAMSKQKSENKEPEKTNVSNVKSSNVKSPRKKKGNDDNQVTFDELVAKTKEAKAEVKESKKVEKEKVAKPTSVKKTTTEKKTTQTKKESPKESKESKKKEEVKEEDSELLIKPVKSSKRKTK